MPHRRKPKIVGPPGLAPPEKHAESDQSFSPQLHDASTWDRNIVQHIDTTPALTSLVKETVRAEMEPLRITLEDTCARLERIELLLFHASFSDFENIDRFISQALEQSEGKQPVESKQVVETCAEKTAEAAKRCLAAQDAEEYEETSGFSTNDIFELLSGMPLSSLSGSSQVLVHSSNDFRNISAPFAGADKSLHTCRLASREKTEKLVARARVACRADASIGKIGTLEDLASFLLVDSLLESTSFVDVFLRGSDGVRYRTAGPIIKVTHIQGPVITVTDASQQPAVDRRGRTIIGQTTMSDEVFCIVGHSRLGGVQIAYSELVNGK